MPAWTVLMTSICPDESAVVTRTGPSAGTHARMRVTPETEGHAASTVAVVLEKDFTWRGMFRASPSSGITQSPTHVASTVLAVKVVVVIDEGVKAGTV